MTNEHMQRMMEFIVEQQAQMAAHLQQLEEERILDRPRMARLEQSYQEFKETHRRLVALAEIVDYRVDRLETITDKLESTTEGLKLTTDELKLTTDELKLTTKRLESVITAQNTRVTFAEEILQRVVRLSEITERRLTTLESRV